MSVMETTVSCKRDRFGCLIVDAWRRGNDNKDDRAGVGTRMCGGLNNAAVLLHSL